MSTTIRTDLAEIIAQIRAMRQYTIQTGFSTRKGQNELLAALNGHDLGTVLVELGDDTNHGKR